MASAPPAITDPSHVYLTMANPPSPAPPSRLFEALKIGVGLLIAVMLGAILIVLIVVPRQIEGIDERQSNERIAQLQREQLLIIEDARRQREDLRREQDRENAWSMLRLNLEKTELIEKQKANMTEEHHQQDLRIEQLRREQDEKLAREWREQQLQIEEHKLARMDRDRELSEQHRKEDISRQNAALLNTFIEYVLSLTSPFDAATLEPKVLSLIDQFDPVHKSLLIRFLYKNKLLTTHYSGDSSPMPLNLEGANLKDLNLVATSLGSHDVGPWPDYTRLSLPSTNLINASLDRMYLNEANFSMCKMLGASFRSSKLVGASFTYTDLSLCDFRNANVSKSNFSSVLMERASFQYVDLSDALFIGSKVVGTNFAWVTARQADFSSAEMSGSSFSMADLSDAIFKMADLSRVNFEGAVVNNADFTKANLQNAAISYQQLDTAFSIALALLPDGSLGKNKNLVQNGEAQCTSVNRTTAQWMSDGNVTVSPVENSGNCVFQALAISTTMKQTINVTRYAKLIEHGQGAVFIQMQQAAAGTLNPSMPPVYANVRYFNSTNGQIGQGSSLSTAWFSPPSTFTASLACPRNTVQIELTVVFRQMHSTVDNIYVTIE